MSRNNAPLLVTVVFVLVLIPLGNVSAAEATTTGTVSQQNQVNKNSLIGEKNCSTIDIHWREYNQTILGANAKISDVVLNACDALGGINSCHFNSGYRSPEYNEKVGGANNSQHIYRRAIDLNVPNGRQAEFITLAICGLRRVNNCKGGIGLYKSGAIHVDVRTGSNSIWSNSYGSGSVVQLQDVGSKNALYGFQGGKCTGEYIVSSYGEEKIYGPPVQYSILKWISNAVTGLVKGSFTTPSNNSFDTSNSLDSYNQFNPLDINSGIQPFDPFFTDFSSGDSNLSSFTIDTPYLKSPLNTSNTKTDTNTIDQAVSPIGGTNIVSCEQNGLFGTSLLSTCDSHNAVDPSKLEVSQNRSQPPLESNLFTSNDGGIVSVIRPDGPIGVFYGVHNPSAVSNFTGDNYSAYETGGAFTTGETQQPITLSTTQLVTDSAQFVTQSARYGAYFGFIHGLSPLIVGSAPRTLLRLGEKVTGQYVNNPFVY